MATSTPTTGNLKAVGALFDDPIDAQKAIDELIEEGIPSTNISMIQQSTYKDDKQRVPAIREYRYSAADVTYFNSRIEQGKTLVSINGVSDDKIGDVIQVLNKNGSQYNPDGSRNLREDVAVMTGGAALGAAIGGAVGGPVGAAFGGVVGATVGGAAGTKLEDSTK